MKKHSFTGTGFIALIIAFSALSWKPVSSVKPGSANDPVAANSANQDIFESYISGIYEASGLKGSDLSYRVFEKAVIGYYNFKHDNLLSKSVIAIVDFTKSSTQKRLWIIDLDHKKILFNTLVAHGQGSGDDLATNFSNLADSHQSSLGFYITDETYLGKHGLSLKLNGMDSGYNTNARDRAIVLHGAEYVSEDFISQHGRLGRSFGCPALPLQLAPKIIDTLKGKSCIYINGPENNYRSVFLDKETAVSGFITANSIVRASI